MCSCVWTSYVCLWFFIDKYIIFSCKAFVIRLDDCFELDSKMKMKIKIQYHNHNHNYECDRFELLYIKGENKSERNEKKNRSRHMLNLNNANHSCVIVHGSNLYICIVRGYRRIQFTFSSNRSQVIWTIVYG